MRDSFRTAMLLAGMVPAALATASTRDPTPQDEAFAGCAIAAPDAALLTISCEAVRATVIQTSREQNPEALLEGALSRLRSSFGGVFVPQEDAISVKDAKRPGRRFSVFKKFGDSVPALRGLAVVLPTRMIDCTAMLAKDGSEKRCETMLGVLADSLPAPNAAAPSSSAAPGTDLAGRLLTVPRGCSSPRAGSIQCETGGLYWRPFEDDSQVTNTLEALRKATSKGGTVRERTVGCRIEGKDEECRVFQATPKEGRVGYTMFGATLVRGQRVEVVCDSPVVPEAELLPPCDQVFAVKADAQALRARIEEVSLAIAADPQEAESYLVRANLKTRLEDFKGCVEDLDTAVRLSPKEAAIFYRRGACRERIDDLKGALEDFTTFIGLRPDHEWGYNDRGQIYEKLGKCEPAVIDFNKALEIRPDWARPHINLGLCLADQKKDRQAIEHYDRAIQLDPAEELAYNNRGAAYLRLKKYEDARRDFSKAIELNPRYAKAYANRAEARFHLGDRVGACGDLDKALELGETRVLEPLRQLCGQRP